MKGATRALLAAAVFGLGGCVAYGLPASTPLKGQSAETMSRDRYECEGVAKTEVRSHPSRHPAPMPTGTAPAPRVQTADREITRQRESVFSACMTARGYRTEP